MISCSGQPEEELSATAVHLEVMISGAVISAFGPLDLGTKVMGCRAFTQEMLGGVTVSAAHVDMDRYAAALLHDIANDLNPLDVREGK